MIKRGFISIMALGNAGPASASWTNCSQLGSVPKGHCARVIYSSLVWYICQCTLVNTLQHTSNSTLQALLRTAMIIILSGVPENSSVFVYTVYIITFLLCLNYVSVNLSIIEQHKTD